MKNLGLGLKKKRISTTYWILQAVILHVKVGGVSGAADFRDVGSLTSADVVPVDAGEEGVALEVLNAVLSQPMLTRADQPAH